MRKKDPKLTLEEMATHMLLGTRYCMIDSVGRIWMYGWERKRHPWQRVVALSKVLDCE